MTLLSGRLGNVYLNTSHVSHVVTSLTFRVLLHFRVIITLTQLLRHENNPNCSLLSHSDIVTVVFEYAMKTIQSCSQLPHSDTVTVVFEYAMETIQNCSLLSHSDIVTVVF